MQIKRAAVAQIENARFVAALQRMRCVPRQADERGAGNLLAIAIGGDVGEVTFEPDIRFVAGVTVVWYDVFGWRPKHDLGTTFGQIASKSGDFNPGWQPLQLQRRPFQFSQISDGLIRAEFVDATWGRGLRGRRDR